MTQKLKDIIDDREPLLTAKAKEIIEDVITCLHKITKKHNEDIRSNITIEYANNRLYINLSKIASFVNRGEIFKMVADIYGHIEIDCDYAEFKYFSLIFEDE